MALWVQYFLMLLRRVCTETPPQLAPAQSPQAYRGTQLVQSVNLEILQEEILLKYSKTERRGERTLRISG